MTQTRQSPGEPGLRGFRAGQALVSDSSIPQYRMCTCDQNQPAEPIIVEIRWGEAQFDVDTWELRVHESVDVPNDVRAEIIAWAEQVKAGRAIDSIQVSWIAPTAISYTLTVYARRGRP